MTTHEKYQEIAHAFCPVFAQKVDDDWPAADQIAPIDFAVPGDIHASVKKNLPELVRRSAINKKFIIENPKVYYSVCETRTHYFLIYAVYHPLDWWKYIDQAFLDDPVSWIRAQFDEHVHDMEGALLVVTKDIPESVKASGAKYGLVDALITISHTHLLIYANPVIWDTKAGKFKPHPLPYRKIVSFQPALGRDRVDFRSLDLNTCGLTGNILIDETTDRVKLYVEARGHGIRGDRDSWNVGDREWWYNVATFKDRFKNSPNPEKEKKRYAFFELEDIFTPKTGLWSFRLNEEVFVQGDNGKWFFASDGYVDSKKRTKRFQPGKANPPWSWNDDKDMLPAGAIATDPAWFIQQYAQGWGPVDTSY
ncbi:MAG: hypothetical protein F9K46_03930, partial [Anaerolineae bacterium]